MAKQKPLIDEEGEVRELTLKDLRQFRPASEVLPPSLLAKNWRGPSRGHLFLGRLKLLCLRPSLLSQSR